LILLFVEMQHRGNTPSFTAGYFTRSFFGQSGCARTPSSSPPVRAATEWLDIHGVPPGGEGE
jgi:hypothetical protein